MNDSGDAGGMLGVWGQHAVDDARGYVLVCRRLKVGGVARIGWVAAYDLTRISGGVSV